MGDIMRRMCAKLDGGWRQFTIIERERLNGPELARVSDHDTH